MGRRGMRWIGAGALALALGLGAASARSEEPRGGESPVPNGPVPKDAPEKGLYQPVGPSERRGRTTDFQDARSEPGEAAPATGGGDPGDFPGESIDLDDLSRSPGPTRKKAAWELEDIPGPLKLRRLPGERPPADAPLMVRLCDADAERTFAAREKQDAVRAYKRARRGEYPRGRDKQLVIERRDIAIRRNDRAQAEYVELAAEADAKHLDFDARGCP